MKKIGIILLLVFIGVALFFTFGAKNSLPSQSIPIPSSTTKTQSQAVLADQEQLFGLPTLLEIPAINVSAPIEQVGMDAKGNMDVPKEDDNVAWYSLGHKIGSKGSAVIAGHFDKRDGSPAVFYDLSELKIGDEVFVVDDKNNRLKFVVVESTSYPFDNFPLQKVFNTTDRPRLNLITCEGEWNKGKGTYSQRLVVSTELSPTSN